MLLEKQNNTDTDLTGSCHHVVLIIPVYQPNENLLCIVDDLLVEPYPKILVINDGSSADKNHVFQKLSKKERVIVLHHKVNKGKGKALKTAFRYVLNELPQSIGVVTLDADGQHLPGDVKMLSETLRGNPESLCLGVREFKQGVPIRSRFGNLLTKYVFSFFVGQTITDTQTGLRGIPLQFIDLFIDIQTDGYEFELETLIQACKQNIHIQEVKITTVYEEHNPTSHFRPLIDSLKIYFVFLKFVSASLLASLVDMIVFSISIYFSHQIFLSIVIGRLVSGTSNFFLVKKAVFHSRGKTLVEAVKYILLTIVLMAGSYLLITSIIIGFGVNPYLSKVIGETILFLISFVVQRSLIFRRKIRHNSISEYTER